jgi:superfamily II DNA or RNA helicase
MAALFKKRPPAPTAGLTWRATESGFRFSVRVNTPDGLEPLKLPLAANPSARESIEDPELLEACLVLDDLLLEEVVELADDDYVLPYLGTQNLDDDQLRALRLPAPEDVNVRVCTRGIISADGYQIVAEIRHPTHGALEGYITRTDNAYRLSDSEVVVLPPDVHALLRTIDAGIPADISDERSARLTYQERVKRRSTKAGAALEGYLANEDYILPEDEALTVTVDVESLDKISIAPNLNMAEGADSTAHQSMNRALASHTPAQGPVVTGVAANGRRVRAIMDRNTEETLSELEPLREVTGADVPRMLDNPEAYLPEGIHLADFSDRVTGIAIERVSVSPSISVTRRDGGVFTFDTKLDVKPIGTAPSEGFPDDNELTAEDLDALINQAKAAGDDYILHKNRWVHVDVASLEQFRNAVETASRKYADNRVGEKEIKGFLEIFTNVDALEYGDSLPLLKELLEESTESDGARYAIPANLRAKLYGYQERGYAWLRFLDEQRWGGLLADDMGLGKTLQAISLLAALKQRGELSPSLVIVPLNVLENWKRELRKFCPSISAYEHHGPNRTRDRQQLADTAARIDLFITTYATLRSDQIALGRIDWRTVILDEAQNIKNPNTGAAEATKALKTARSRIALTGTPVENGLSELWSIFDFVQPGHLGSYRDFRRDFEKPIQGGGHDAEASAEELKSKIKDLYLRRLKEDELDSLPEKSIKRTEVAFGDEQLSLYADYVSRGSTATKGEKLGIFQRLVQVASHPLLVKEVPSFPKADELIAQCPKLAATVEILDTIRDQKERVLIFTEYKKMQEILMIVLRERYGIWPGRINGEVLSRDRQNLVDKLNASSDFDALVLSPTAGGVGLNIIGANHVIHYTRPWNPAKEAQATDRVHRIGQERPVTVYYPIVTHPDMPTIETRIDDLLKQKSQLARDIITTSQGLNVTQQELADLLGTAPSPATAASPAAAAESL